MESMSRSHLNIFVSTPSHPAKSCAYVAPLSEVSLQKEPLEPLCLWVREFAHSFEHAILKMFSASSFENPFSCVYPPKHSRNGFPIWPASQDMSLLQRQNDELAKHMQATELVANRWHTPSPSPTIPTSGLWSYDFMTMGEGGNPNDPNCGRFEFVKWCCFDLPNKEVSWLLDISIYAIICYTFRNFLDTLLSLTKRDPLLKTQSSYNGK